MLEQALGGGYRGCTEILGCSQLQAQGVMDLQGHLPKKKGGGSKRRYKKQLAAAKNNCMALQKITMAIKKCFKLFGGGRRRQEVSKMPWGWIAE